MFRVLKRLILLVMLIAIGLPVGVGIFALEETPAVEPRPPVNAADMQRTRRVLSRFRQLTETETASVFKLSERDLDAMLAAAARVVPGLRGDGRIGGDRLQVAASLELPIPWRPWLNLDMQIVPDTDGLRFGRFALGPVEIPPSLVMPALALALDVGVGGGTGALARGAIGRVEISGRELAAEVEMDRSGRKALAAQVKDRVRSLADIAKGDEVAPYVRAMIAAREAGRLPSNGTVLPYLRFAVAEAADRATPGGERRALQTAFFALAYYCGTYKFHQIVGDVLAKEEWHKTQFCGRTTLGGRVDLRQHFMVSAGLQAAGGADAAFGIGEIKELLDSGTGGGSGFSFDDLAADAAGLRFAKVMLALPPAAWSPAMARIRSEADILPPISGLASGLTSAEFARIYGDLDDPRYRAMLAEINNRIDALAFHAGRS